MAERRPLVQIGGQFHELPEGDVLSGLSAGQVSFRLPHTFAVSGTLAADQVIVPFRVPVPEGQSATLVGVRHSIQDGTGITVAVARNGTAVGGLDAIEVTTAPGTASPTEPESLADGDALSIALAAPSGTPRDLSLTLLIDYTVETQGIGGGLSYFAEARNTDAPNTTVPVHALAAAGEETNIDLALPAKGTGAITAQVPDGSASGGNKRGQHAVDLQTSRNAANQVASGDYAAIGGGLQNRAASIYASVGGGVANVLSGAPNGVIGGGNSNQVGGASATVAGGQSNNAGVIYATVCGGNSNSITAGNAGFIGGGQGNQVTGAFGAVGGGQDNLCNGNYSWIPGGYGGSAKGIFGRGAYAGVYVSTKGDRQIGWFALTRTTTDASPAILTTTHAGPAANNVAALTNNSAYGIRASITARASDGSCKRWVVEGLVKRGASASATAVVGTPSKTVIAADTGTDDWDVALVADTTRGSAEIEVTGAAGTTIAWICRFDTEEVG